MPPLGHCDSAVGAPHLITIKNASRATSRVNNFANGKGALSVTKAKPGKAYQRENKIKSMQQPTGTGGTVTKPLRFSIQIQYIENLSSANKESVHHLKTLLNTIDESITTFEDLGRLADQWDDILNYFSVGRLANGTRLD